MNGRTDLEAFAPETDMPLDLALRSGGIETFESSAKGGPAGPRLPEPTIRFHGGIGEGFKAYGIARELCLPVSSIRLYYDYDVLDGVLHGP